MKMCLLPARVGIFAFAVIMIKVPFHICTSTWRVSKYVSRQGKVINKKNKSTIIKSIFVGMDTLLVS